MRAHARRVLVALTILVTSALEAAPVDSSLAYVSTDGYWEYAGRRGSYRVLVFSGGFEHVSSRVVAEWVAEPLNAESTAAVVHEVEVVGPGFFSFGAPVLTRIDGGERLTLRGVDTHSPETTIVCVFDLLPDRKVRAVQPCG